MMVRAPTLASVLLLAACSGGGGSAGNNQVQAATAAPADGNYYPDAGEWRVDTTLVSVEGPLVTDERRRQIQAATPPSSERRCLNGQAPRVGEVASAGARCTYARIADQASRVERDVTCQGAQTGQTRGEQFPDRFDWVITVRNTEGPAAGTQAQMREVGRRIAATCSADLRAAGGQLPITTPAER